MSQANEVCWGRGAEHRDTGELSNDLELRSPGNGSLPQGAANTLETYGIHLVDANLPQPTTSLQVHAVFDVEADATVRGAVTSGTEAWGSLTLAAEGEFFEKIVVDADPDTAVPDRFTGQVVLTTTIPNAYGGWLGVKAGVYGLTTIPAGDSASAFTDITAKLRYVQVGGTAPTPTPAPSPTHVKTFTAPFGGSAEVRNQRYDPFPRGGFGPVEGAATFDDSGEFSFDLDAMGAAPATHGGWHEGLTTLRVPLSGIARGSDVTVKAVWEVDSFSTLHTPCPVFYACNVGSLDSSLRLEDEQGYVLPSNDESGDAAIAWEWAFFDGGQSLRDQSTTVELVVTANDVATTELAIVTLLDAFVEGEIGYGELQSTGRLKSITVSHS